MKQARYILLLIVVFSMRVAIAQNAFEQMATGQYTNATAIPGWTVETAATNTGSCYTNTFNQPNSGFWIRQTPIGNHPYIGTIPNSPLGGAHVTQLNSVTGSTLMTRMRTTINVTSANSMFSYAFCGSWADGGHGCCQQAFFTANLYDCSGTLLPCYTASLNAPGASCATGGVQMSFTTTGTIVWTNWQIKYIDLSQYIGSCVTFEIRAGDCYQGDHHGMAYFDALAGSSPLIGQGLSPYTVMPANIVNYCPGSTVATIIGPPGYLYYQWVSPATGTIPAYLGGTSSSLTLNTPLAGSVFTLNLSNGNCNYLETFTISNSVTGIAGIGSSPSCPLGSAGSATVMPSGANSYSYSWVNSANAVVSSASVASNLPAGNYTVTVGGGTCGNATAIVSVGTATPGATSFLNYYCNGEAYLNANNGTGYQWYHNLTAIAAPLGTAQSLTASAAGTSDIYRVTFMNTGGCKDSVEFYLDPSAPGVLSVSNNSNCPGSGIGFASVNLYPSLLSNSSQHSFSVISTGTTPAYSTTVITSSPSFSLNNLAAGGTYSLMAFDGFCRYNSTFTVLNNTMSPSAYSLTPASPTVCAGTTLMMNVQPASTLYHYSWSNVAAGTNSTLAFAIIQTPTVAYGGLSTSTHTVVVTPTLIPCPQTLTYAITVVNPVTPTLPAVPDLCSNAASYIIQATPPGGTFVPSSIAGGTLLPSLAQTGVNTFSYTYGIGSCSVQKTGTFAIHASPNLTVSGNTPLCYGNSTTLTVSGANIYQWNNLPPGPSLVLTPSSTAIYTVQGTNTLFPCSASKTVMVSVFPLPTLAVTGNTAICRGQTTTLTACGMALYRWNSASPTDSVFVTTPSVTTTYPLSGANAYGCNDSTNITVTVLPTATLGISGNTLVCAGGTVALYASGASSYSWSTGETTPVIIVAPTSTNHYTLFGVSVTNSCISSADIQIQVSACVGISTEQEENGIQLFPNPASDHVHLTFSKKLQVVLTTAEGALLYESTFGTGTHRLDLSVYSAGIYILTAFEPGGGTTHFKLIKVQ